MMLNKRYDFYYLRMFGIITLSLCGFYLMMMEQRVSADAQDSASNRQLFLPLLNGGSCQPTNGALLEFGTARSGNILPTTDIDRYYLCGAQGDVIRFDLGRTSNNFDPQIEVYRPDGSLLCGDDTIFAALTVECTLDQNGSFIVLVSDAGADDTGHYSFFTQRVNSPSNFDDLSYGFVVTDAINPITEHETYRMLGSAGQVIRFDLAKTSGDYEPNIVIYRPDGTRLCADGTIFSGITLECTLDVGGAFTVLIGERGLNATGNFSLYLQNLSEPANPVAINYDDVTVGAITAITEHKTYTIDGVSGDIIRFDLAKTSGNYEPAITIYRPDGTRLCGDSTIFDGLTLRMHPRCKWHLSRFDW